MPIKKYYSTADTTITNAYKEDLQTRGTGSNMGLSDSLETFTIYNQVNYSASGNTVTTGAQTEAARILIKFDAATVKSDYDAATVPSASNFYLRLYNAKHPMTLPKNYSLEVYPLTRSFTEGHGLDMEDYSDEAEANWVFANTDSITLQGTFSSITGSGVTGSGTAFTTQLGTAKKLKIQIDGSSEYETFTISSIESATLLTIASTASNTLSASTAMLTDGAWLVNGAMSDVNTVLGTVSFADGDEDLLLDITSHVNTWRDSASNHKGLLITFPTSSLDETRSYYTKKFFARGTEYYYKQPTIEARWNDSVLDDSGQTYKISTRLSNDDNTNNLYLYNWYNGALQNISGNPQVVLKLYSDSTRSTELSGSTNIETITSASTGIYKAQVRVDTDATTIYTKWYSGSTTYHEDSLTVSARPFKNDYNEPEYIISMPNLKSSYTTDEATRLRLYTRLKDWSPTIYTVASKDIENQIVTKAYYKVIRLVDDVEAIGYGTGSVKYTKLSYDISGSYFDLDMSLFESGYAYGLKFVFDINGKYREQPETFKFRVD